MNANTAFKMGKHGPRLDPRGAQVVWNGRLWDVVGAGYSEHHPVGFFLDLRSFNRELTARAPISTCDVLERQP